MRIVMLKDEDEKLWLFDAADIKVRNKRKDIMKGYKKIDDINTSLKEEIIRKIEADQYYLVSIIEIK